MPHNDVMKRYGDLDLAVACSSGVATLWLAPRIGPFMRATPTSTCALSFATHLHPSPPSEFDVGLYYCVSHVAHSSMRNPLIDDEAFPVCSPSNLDGRLVTPEELTRQTLLMQDDRQMTWMSWEEWLNLNGVPMPKKPRAIISNLYPHWCRWLCTVKAYCSDGVKSSTATLRRNRSFVQHVNRRRSVVATTSYNTPSDRAMNRATTLFASWLLQQCATATVWEPTGNHASGAWVYSYFPFFPRCSTPLACTPRSKSAFL